MDVREWIDKRTIYKVVSGSHSYGTNLPTSDLDVRGICIPPKEYYFGLHNFEQHISQQPDETIFSLNKFFKLAFDCNPNIVELLFVDERHILEIDRFGQMLRDNRHLFLSQRALHTFSGYAHSQLQRIKHHFYWLQNPVTERPEQSDDKYIRTMNIGEFKRDLFNTALYDEDLKKFNQYQEWKKNRNQKRSELEEKFGYDTKHCAHLFRLLNMGIEILRTGNLTVDRTNIDASFLLDIRRGLYTYETMLEKAEILFEEIKIERDSSKLPVKPDFEKINNLLCNITNDFLKTTKEN